MVCVLLLAHEGNSTGLVRTLNALGATDLHGVVPCAWSVVCWNGHGNTLAALAAEVPYQPPVSSAALACGVQFRGLRGEDVPGVHFGGMLQAGSVQDCVQLWKAVRTAAVLAQGSSGSLAPRGTADDCTDDLTHTLQDAADRAAVHWTFMTREQQDAALQLRITRRAADKLVRQAVSADTPAAAAHSGAVVHSQQSMQTSTAAGAPVDGHAPPVAGAAE